MEIRVGGGKNEQEGRSAWTKKTSSRPSVDTRLKRVIECTTSMLTSALWFPLKSQRLSNDLCIPTLAWLWLKTFPFLSTQKYNQGKKNRPSHPCCTWPHGQSKIMALDDLWKVHRSKATSLKAFSNQSQCAKRSVETGFTWIHLYVSKPSGETGRVIFLRLSTGSFHLLDFWQQVLKFSFYPSVFFSFLLLLLLL